MEPLKSLETISFTFCEYEILNAVSKKPH